MVAALLAGASSACSVVVNTDGLASEVTGGESGGGKRVADAGGADGSVLGAPSTPPPPAPENDAGPTSDPPIDAGVPASDGGVPDAAPPSVCSTGRARVFVTQSMYSANLGGVAGADIRCQTSADARGIGGKWRAWLSDSTQSAAQHVFRSPGAYVLLDGTVVATSFASLTSGALAHAINRTEANAQVTDGQTEVWTGLDLTGGQASSGFCASQAGDWTSSANGALTPLVGHLDATDATWSAAYLQTCDRNNVRLYCFETCP